MVYSVPQANYPCVGLQILQSIGIRRDNICIERMGHRENDPLAPADYAKIIVKDSDLH